MNKNKDFEENFDQIIANVYLMNRDKDIEANFDPVLANIYLAALCLMAMFQPEDRFYLPLEKRTESLQFFGRDFDSLKRFNIICSKPLLFDPFKGIVFFENGPILKLNLKEQWILSKKGKRCKVKHIIEHLPNYQMTVSIEIDEIFLNW